MAALTPPPLDNSLGVVSIGVVVSAAIYGLTGLQTFNYFQQQAKKAKKDPGLLRACVSFGNLYLATYILTMAKIVFLWIIESLHSACITHALYFYSRDIRSIILPTGLTSLVGSIVQACFAWRVYIMSDRNKSLVFLIRLFKEYSSGSWIDHTTCDWLGHDRAWGSRFKYRLFADLGHFEVLIIFGSRENNITYLFFQGPYHDILDDYGRDRRGGAESRGAILSSFHKSNLNTYHSTDNLIQKLITYTINGGILCRKSLFELPFVKVRSAQGFRCSGTLIDAVSLNARTNLREANERGIPLDFVGSGPALASQQRSGGVTVTTVIESAGNQKEIHTQGYKFSRINEAEDGVTMLISPLFAELPRYARLGKQEIDKPDEQQLKRYRHCSFWPYISTLFCPRVAGEISPPPKTRDNANHVGVRMLRDVAQIPPSHNMSNLRRCSSSPKTAAAPDVVPSVRKTPAQTFRMLLPPSVHGVGRGMRWARAYRNDADYMCGRPQDVRTTPGVGEYVENTKIEIAESVLPPRPPGLSASPRVSVLLALHLSVHVTIPHPIPPPLGPVSSPLQRIFARVRIPIALDLFSFGANWFAVHICTPYSFHTGSPSVLYWYSDGLYLETPGKPSEVEVNYPEISVQQQHLKVDLVAFFMPGYKKPPNMAEFKKKMRQPWIRVASVTAN
ncbi:hypothetical protein B0H19DRAFT_1076024 [Mycena capillaripes]|nr:hypothetical protein B0H19DRAFT_1076024 [Mycena capillaripes]